MTYVLGCGAEEPANIMHLQCLGDSAKACDVGVDEVEEAMRALAHDDKRDMVARVKELNAQKSGRQSFRSEWCARRAATRAGGVGGSSPASSSGRHAAFFAPGYTHLGLVPAGAIGQPEAPAPPSRRLHMEVPEGRGLVWAL